MSDASKSTNSATRRGIMAGAAALAPLSALVAGGADAATPNRAALARAVENGKEASVQRIRDWIAHPTICAEHLNVPEGAQYPIDRYPGRRALHRSCPQVRLETCEKTRGWRA